MEGNWCWEGGGEELQLGGWGGSMYGRKYKWVWNRREVILKSRGYLQVTYSPIWATKRSNTMNINHDKSINLYPNIETLLLQYAINPNYIWNHKFPQCKNTVYNDTNLENNIITFGKSWVILRICTPLRPMMYLWSQLGASTVAVCTLLAFSYTMFKAKNI